MSSMTGFKQQATGQQLPLTGQNKIPKGYQQGQLQQFSPEQIQLFKQLFSHVGPDSYLSRLAGGDEGTFSQIEAPALKQFGALQGNIASRFSGMGSGARRSSGFQNTQTSAAQDFASQLQSQRQSLQQQATNDLYRMSNELLNQRPYEQFLTDAGPSGWQKFGSAGKGALSGAASGAAIGSVIPGVGTAIGAGVGGLIGGIGGFFS